MKEGQQGADGIKRADFLQMYYYLRLTRTLEDRITALYRQGRIVGGVYTSNGMEAISVAYASDNETLHPGDVIGTGTVGLGCSMDMHRWPRVGQTFTIEVQGIGSLTHRIVPGHETPAYVRNGMDGLLGPAPGTSPTGPRSQNR